MKKRHISMLQRYISDSTSSKGSNLSPTLQKQKFRIKRQSRYSNLVLSLAVVVLVIASTCPVEGSPRSICLRNCHLCQQMYGEHFEGHLCAHTCVRLRGRLIPDCTDLVSIAPYLDPTVTNKVS